MDYKDLRKKYPEFVYKSFSYLIIDEDLVITYLYEIKPDINFKHHLIIKTVGNKRYNKIDKKVLDNLVFNIGLVEIPSYWKTVCSPLIRIEAGSLDKWQNEWWKKLYLKGMLQYFYENKIDFRGENFLTIISSAKGTGFNKGTVKRQKSLIPIGGGKDSAVTLGLNERSNKEFGTIVIEKATPAAHYIANLTISDHLGAVRKLDLENILKLNERGFLNGHIPYSAALYFVSLLAAYIFDYSQILFSNENSSKEGNVGYLGKEVNHQYSKTLEFEKDFINYNKKYLSNINLFSFLRPLYEIQISKIFSGLPKYFSTIRSCNKGQKDGVWCGLCPKCLSTYILLLPFLGNNKTVSIFGKNLLSDENLKDLLFDLIDDERTKPFECVGTRIEIKVALNMAINLNREDKLPILLQIFKSSKEYDPDMLKNEEINLMRSFGKNNLPKEFLKILKSNI